jgi:hypothetical protein
MKYFLIIFAFIIWAALTWSNNAKANDYTTDTTDYKNEECND